MKVEQADRDAAATPAAASFDVGTYSDGSGPQARVWYDTKPGPCCDTVWVETGSNNWIAVGYEAVEELIAALRASADAIEARQHKVAV